MTAVINSGSTKIEHIECELHIFLSKLQAGPHILSVLCLRIKPAVFTDATFTQTSRELSQWRDPGLQSTSQAHGSNISACSSILQAVTQPSIHSASTPSPH